MLALSLVLALRMRPPSLSRARPPSRVRPPSHALALPLVRSPSLACNHPPLSISCTRPPSHAPTHPFVCPPSLSFSCTRPPSRSRAPACPLILTAVLVVVVLLLQLPLPSLLALLQLQQQLLLLPRTRACSFLCACRSSGLCASAPCLSFLLSVHQYL